MTQDGDRPPHRTRRTPIRMCAHCHQMTSTPVVVHEEHAATGPGFTVYACQGCAAHYPPPSDALEFLDAARGSSELTLRVYRVPPAGRTDQSHAEPGPEPDPQQA